MNMEEAWMAVVAAADDNMYLFTVQRQYHSE